MPRATKAVLALLALGALYLGFSLVVSFQNKLAQVTAGLFEDAECELGRMPESSEAFLRQADPNPRAFARALWADHGIRAWVVVQGTERHLRVSGTYVWPFAREEPAGIDCGDHAGAPRPFRERQKPAERG